MEYYCGNPDCRRKISRKYLYVKVGFEQPVCKDCFADKVRKLE